jgi:hypothetical protein
MTLPDLPGDEAGPAVVSRFLQEVMARVKLRGILIGTTAALALGDMNVRSKDTDALGLGQRTRAS